MISALRRERAISMLSITRPDRPIRLRSSGRVSQAQIQTITRELVWVRGWLPKVLFNSQEVEVLAPQETVPRKRKRARFVASRAREAASVHLSLARMLHGVGICLGSVTESEQRSKRVGGDQHPGSTRLNRQRQSSIEVTDKIVGSTGGVHKALSIALCGSFTPVHRV